VSCWLAGVGGVAVFKVLEERRDLGLRDSHLADNVPFWCGELRQEVGEQNGEEWGIMWEKSRKDHWEGKRRLKWRVLWLLLGWNWERKLPFQWNGREARSRNKEEDGWEIKEWGKRLELDEKMDYLNITQRVFAISAVCHLVSADAEKVSPW
jgi:hypothetical protein